MEINGWLVNASEDGQYLYVDRDGAPGQIHIKAEDEGFAVDIFADVTVSDDEVGPSDSSVDSAFALYTELEPE